MLRVVVPTKEKADISRHAPREIHNLVSDAVAAWLQVIEPELIDLKSYARQRLFPTRFLLIDRPAIVGA